ncbi:hypothetical protein KUW00_02915 [Halomonas sp. DP5N14-9]|nr:hypothetical protein [Halomonas sp. DP5N14-9]
MNVRIKGLFYASVGGTQAPALHVEGGVASTLNTSKKTDRRRLFKWGTSPSAAPRNKNRSAPVLHVEGGDASTLNTHQKRSAPPGGHQATPENARMRRALELPEETPLRAG